MRRNTGSVVLAVALASALSFTTACRKKSDESEEVKEPTAEAPVSTTLPANDEVTVANGDETSNTTADRQLTDFQIELGRPPLSTNPDGSPVALPDEGRLGYGNSCNGSFATGNNKYHFFIVHPAKHIIAIQMENRSSGEAYLIYSPKPVKDIENSLDMLTLADQYLYFRENMTSIKRLDLTDFSVKEIAEGSITRLNQYGESLFFCKDGSIVRCDLDGSNEEVLFTATVGDPSCDIAFCVTDDKILFSDPKEESSDGLAYGKIYAMDLDGQNQEEILPDAIAGNTDVFFSDGENLYFYGQMPENPDMIMLSDPDMTVIGNDFVVVDEQDDDHDDADTKISGYFCVKLDGSETCFIQTCPDGSVNAVDGSIFWSVADTIFASGEDVEAIDEYDGIEIVGGDDIVDWKFVIIDDWVYYSYINPEGSGEARTRRSSLRSPYIVDLDWPAIP
ncbi:MAG: DUF5050 domain-containing protein [Clostridiales bacterium]|nr:DUF5050 domain-containing protein [Clostridiales bacterium]